MLLVHAARFSASMRREGVVWRGQGMFEEGRRGTRAFTVACREERQSRRSAAVWGSCPLADYPKHTGNGTTRGGGGAAGNIAEAKPSSTAWQ